MSNNNTNNNSNNNNNNKMKEQLKMKENERNENERQLNNERIAMEAENPRFGGRMDMFAYQVCACMSVCLSV